MPGTPLIAVRKVSRWPRRLLIAGAVVAGLFGVEVSTYLAWAHASMPVAGLSHLRLFQSDDLREGRRFVVVEGDAWAALDEDQKAALDRALRKFTPSVYHSMEEVPVDVLPFRPFTEQERADIQGLIDGGRLGKGRAARLRAELAAGQRRMVPGASRGAELSWFLHEAGFLWMKSSVSEFRSGLGAEWRTDVYIWLPGRWVRVWQVARLRS